MVAMMGWANPEQGWRKGPWTPEEDKLLSEYVNLYGEGRWSSVARESGLNRSGKSCRLRWVNYLRPGLKKGQLTPQEEGIIIELHALWGNKWSTIARYLPGRTDNEIKNYWRTHFKKRERTAEKQEKRKTHFIKQKWQHHQQLNQAQSAEKMQDEAQFQEGKQQEMPSLMYNPTTMGAHQGLTLPMMSYKDSTWVDYMVEDIGLWGDLWNLLDDDQAHVDFTTTNCNNVDTRNEDIDYACFGEGSFQ